MGSYKASRFGNNERGSKEVETLEDALFVMGAFSNCGGTSCGECGVKMYGDEGCHTCRAKAMNLLLEAVGLEYRLDGDGDGGVTKQAELYKALFEEGFSGSLAKTATHCSGTCAECQFSQMHCSGILWCKSFGNFVHENGYCYRFASSVTMEEMGR